MAISDAIPTSEIAQQSPPDRMKQTNSWAGIVAETPTADRVAAFLQEKRVLTPEQKKTKQDALKAAVVTTISRYASSTDTFATKEAMHAMLMRDYVETATDFPPTGELDQIAQTYIRMAKKLSTEQPLRSTDQFVRAKVDYNDLPTMRMMLELAVSTNSRMITPELREMVNASQIVVVDSISEAEIRFAQENQSYEKYVEDCRNIYKTEPLPPAEAQKARTIAQKLKGKITSKDELEFQARVAQHGNTEAFKGKRILAIGDNATLGVEGTMNQSVQDVLKKVSVESTGATRDINFTSAGK